jgi:hypothetical protein
MQSCGGSAASRACRRFLIALLSGFAFAVFALAALAGGCVSIAPPSVAIFVEAGSGADEAGAFACSDAAETGSDAAGAGSVGRDKACTAEESCSRAAVLVSSTGPRASPEAVVSALAGAASLRAGFSETGFSGFAVSGDDASSLFSAAIFSGSAAVEMIAACSAGAASA